MDDEMVNIVERRFGKNLCAIPGRYARGALAALNLVAHVPIKRTATSLPIFQAGPCPKSSPRRSIMSDDLCYLSAADAGRKIAAKELSSRELTEALLTRTAAVDGKLNAYIRLLSDQARAAAKAADKALQWGYQRPSAWCAHRPEGYYRFGRRPHHGPFQASARQCRSRRCFRHSQAKARGRGDHRQALHTRVRDWWPGL